MQLEIYLLLYPMIQTNSYHLSDIEGAIMKNTIGTWPLIVCNNVEQQQILETRIYFDEGHGKPFVNCHFPPNRCSTLLPSKIHIRAFRPNCKSIYRDFGLYLSMNSRKKLSCQIITCIIFLQSVRHNVLMDVAIVQFILVMIIFIAFVFWETRSVKKKMNTDG